ncbi:hypothetical protein [Ferrimicrobium sp.]|uniref:hypothetical protein n=1 Tax=Ferrimicrobium sp. TaxID=2926050 RepID=UPI00261642DE|nr:hypothetical protein [Ferrimicrobium sp.]
MTDAYRFEVHPRAQVLALATLNGSASAGRRPGSSEFGSHVGGQTLIGGGACVITGSLSARSRAGIEELLA